MSDEQPRTRPSFWSFNIGHVLTLVGFLVASISAYYALRSDLASQSDRVVRIEHTIDSRVSKMETTLNQLATGVVDNARQDERIRGIERRLDRIEDSPKK